jgi:hypothetical protein
LNELGAVCQFPLSANSESLLLPEITEPVSSGNAGKLSAMNVNGLSIISLLQKELPDGYEQATYYGLSHWNHFLQFKEQD